MPPTLEREIKLRFESVDQARAAVGRIGASRIRGRRLQQDYLLEIGDGSLLDRRSTLRVRMEPEKSFLTFKGPIQPGPTKVREELETAISDGPFLLRIFERLGFHVSFHYQKYREEFCADDAIIAIDETPVGVFIEIEGGERGIADITAALGRGPADYVLDSYRGLFVRYCEERGVPVTDMLFEPG